MKVSTFRWAMWVVAALALVALAVSVAVRICTRTCSTGRWRPR